MPFGPSTCSYNTLGTHPACCCAGAKPLDMEDRQAYKAMSSPLQAGLRSAARTARRDLSPVFESTRLLSIDTIRSDANNNSPGQGAQQQLHARRKGKASSAAPREADFSRTMDVIPRLDSTVQDPAIPNSKRMIPRLDFGPVGQLSGAGGVSPLGGQQSPRGGELRGPRVSPLNTRRSQMHPQDDDWSPLDSPRGKQLETAAREDSASAVSLSPRSPRRPGSNLSSPRIPVYRP